MRVVLWCCRIFIFLFLLAFALKNTEPVSVSFFFETSWPMLPLNAIQFPIVSRSKNKQSIAIEPLVYIF